MDLAFATPVGTRCAHCGRTVPDLDKHLGTTSASSNCPELRHDFLLGENFFDDDLPGDDYE